MTGHYRSNLRDQIFQLFEVLGVEDVLGKPPFGASGDPETARDVLSGIEAFASGPLAASFAAADRNPPTFDPSTHEVRVAPEFLASFQAYADGEWQRLDLPESLGGYGLPNVLKWACAEHTLGANPAIFFYAGRGMASVLAEVGNDAQRVLAQTMIDRQWGATMLLTEADAGSDVGAQRATATLRPDGTWHLDGVKRFITSGDWDWPENIVHFVLARPVGVPGAGGPGTKGLSLFVVPKWHVTDWATGTLGERNGVYATGLENKMGFATSATCEISLGRGGVPAIGYLVDDRHDGIRQMFRIIELARMMVGTKAISTLSTAYLNAKEYALTRVQGPDLARTLDKTSPRVRIADHPDVRRTLMDLKAAAEGLRSLALYTAWQRDVEALALEQNRPTTALAAAVTHDLLLPVVKGYGSERALELLPRALQVAGGSGYLKDYPFEQYLRDAVVDTLYEGTTAIQGLDLFFRKVARDGGATLARLLAQVTADADACPPELQDVALLIRTAVNDVDAMVRLATGWLAESLSNPERVYLVGLNSTGLLRSLGDLLTSWRLLVSARVAVGVLAKDKHAEADNDFYAAKASTARWHATTVLPELATRLAAMRATDPSVMRLPVERL